MAFKNPSADGLTLAPNQGAVGTDPAASVQELEQPNFWGRYALTTQLPNVGTVDGQAVVGANAAAEPAYSKLRPGDRALVGTTPYRLTDRGGVSGSNAVWINDPSGMPIYFPDGTVSAPSITFLLDPNTGFWRPGNGIVGVTGDGLEVVRFQAPTGINPQALFAAGAAALPSISFAGDPNTGIWNTAVDDIRLTFGGTFRNTFLATSFTTAQANTVYTFNMNGIRSRWVISTRMDNAADTDAGLTINQVTASIGASIAQQHVLISSTINQTGTSAFSQLVLDQTQTALGSGNQRFEDLRVAGTTVYAITSDATMPGQVQLPNGSAARPALSFLSDPDTGLYGNGANTLQVSTGGTQRWIFEQNLLEGRQSAMTITTNASGNVMTVQGFVTTQTSAPLTLSNRGTFSGASVAQLGVRIDHTINQTGTSSFSQLVLDQTQTALGSGNQRFEDLRVAGTTVYAITSDATMPGQVQLPNGSAARPALSFLSDPNSGWYSSAADVASLSLGGTARYSGSATALYPAADNTYALGIATTNRWSTIYAVTTNIGDQVMREPFPGDKPLDQVAHIRLIEDVDGLVLYNIRTGKKHRVVLDDVEMTDADHAIIARDRAEHGWAERDWKAVA